MFSDATFMLGCLLERSGEGVSKDVAAAKEKHAEALLAAKYFFTQAAKEKHAEAQYRLGRMLERGRCGVPMDCDAAASWYRMAEKQGHAEAQFRLGRMYERQAGASKSKDDAQKLLTRASTLFNAAANNNNFQAKLHLSTILDDPSLRSEALDDYDTVPFHTAADLEHGDTVVGYYWFMGLILWEEWALFDKHNNGFIGIMDVFGYPNEDRTVTALRFQGRLALWNKKGRCRHPGSRDYGSGALDSRGFQNQ